MSRKSHLSLIRVALTILAILSFLSPASAAWKEKVLYSFQAGTDGKQPAGGVVFDKVGNIYGTTTDGGGVNCNSPFQCGTVYQLAPPTKKGGLWTETVLYVFKGATQEDGASPFSGLLIDGSGNLYGTTGYGGAGVCNLLGGNVGCGTIFELSPPKTKGGQWTEKVLYSFQGNTDGQLPWQDLTFDSKGNLYGVTYYGGGFGDCNKFYGYCGTVFKLSPKGNGGKWTEQVLYRFKGIASGKTNGDGANPNGGLTFDKQGAIYGATSSGGFTGSHCLDGEGFFGCGTLFKLTPRSKGKTWSESLLYVFKGDVDGSVPNGNLTVLKSGVIGTAWSSGEFAGGVLFRVTPGRANGGGGETVLYQFGSNRHDGSSPESGLLAAAGGKFFGSTSSGTKYGDGTVFEITGGGSGVNLTTLHIFQDISEGANDSAMLRMDARGNLYGTTIYGGNTEACVNTGCGLVFELVKP